MLKRLRAWEQNEGAAGAPGSGPAAQAQQSLLSGFRLPALFRGAEHETKKAKKQTAQQPLPPQHKQAPCFVYDLEGRPCHDQHFIRFHAALCREAHRFIFQG